MSSIGTGYDLFASTFSPDGRVFQVEYAQKAVDNSGTCMGIRCTDGVVVAVEKPAGTALELPTTKSRVFNISKHIGAACTGMYCDMRALVTYAQSEAQEYQFANRAQISVDQLLYEVSDATFKYTTGPNRPFGCSAMFVTWDEVDGGRLFVLEPSALYYEYYAWAVGKQRQPAKAEIEKLDLKKLTCADAINELARIMLSTRDEHKDVPHVTEMGWIGKHTDGIFRRVPQAIIDEAEAWAKKKLDESDTESESGMQT